MKYEVLLQKIEQLCAVQEMIPVEALARLYCHLRGIP